MLFMKILRLITRLHLKRFLVVLSHRAQPISCLDDPIKTTTFILAFFSDDFWKVLDENVQTFNSLFQGYSN